MKKRTVYVVTAAVLGFVAVAPPARADLFGGDIPLLAQILSNGIQMLRNGQQIYQNAQQTAAFFRNPALIKAQLYSNLLTYSASMQAASNGRDATTVRTYSDGLGTMTHVMQEINASSSLTTGNAALAAMLQLQAAQTKQQRDQLQTRLQYEQDLQNYASAEGYGLGSCVSCTIHRVIR